MERKAVSQPLEQTSERPTLFHLPHEQPLSVLSSNAHGLYAEKSQFQLLLTLFPTIPTLPAIKRPAHKEQLHRFFFNQLP